MVGANGIKKLRHSTKPKQTKILNWRQKLRTNRFKRKDFGTLLVQTAERNRFKRFSQTEMRLDRKSVV